MHEICRKWIVEILKSHMPLIAIAVRQRSKFERWLQFELAWFAEKQGAQSVKGEDSSANGGFSDISFRFGETRYFVELKTVLQAIPAGCATFNE